MRRRHHKSRHQRLLEAKAAAFDRLYDQAPPVLEPWDDEHPTKDELYRLLLDELVMRGLARRPPPSPPAPDFIGPMLDPEKFEKRIAAFGAFLAQRPF